MYQLKYLGITGVVSKTSCKENRSPHFHLDLRESLCYILINSSFLFKIIGLLNYLVIVTTKVAKKKKIHMELQSMKTFILR